MNKFTSYPISSLNGENIIVAGDKSISHRSLMLSSMVLGETRISGLLEGEDVLATIEALKKLGVSVEKHGLQWIVQGVGVGGLQAPTQILDMGNAGTGARLMIGLLSSYNFLSFFTGDASLNSRPMLRVIKPLSQIGAGFTAREGKFLPLAMQGAENPLPIEYELPVASAQVKSAILLAGLNITGTTNVIEKIPTRDHTERMLKSFGFKVDIEDFIDGKRISLHGHQILAYKNREIIVPSDPSSAAFLIVAAIITKNSSITVNNICMNETRIGFLKTLQEMGANIAISNKRESCGEIVADITAKSSALNGMEIPASRAASMIDEYPIIAVAAAFAKGETLMQGLGELRVKESDRLSAIINGLTANGVQTNLEGDNLIIYGAKSVRGGGNIITSLDHRIAMSFAVLAMASLTPIHIDDYSAISTSFPDFIELMNSLGAKIEIDKIDKNAKIIAIDGLAASGKGTLSRRLAENFNYAYLDTGSLYRAVGLKLVYANIDPTNKEEAIKAANSLCKQDLLNPRLRQETVGRAASIISAMSEVRAILLKYQRDFSKNINGAILDGRDIGTVICPNADVKLFITASLETRADRRHRELQGEGVEVVYNSVLEDLRERDERDIRRQSAPLTPADDAIVIDTTNMNADEVFEKVLEIINNGFINNGFIKTILS